MKLIYMLHMLYLTCVLVLDGLKLVQMMFIILELWVVTSIVSIRKLHISVGHFCVFQTNYIEFQLRIKSDLFVIVFCDEFIFSLPIRKSIIHIVKELYIKNKLLV